jgi:hypothetical protein
MGNDVVPSNHITVLKIKDEPQMKKLALLILTSILISCASDPNKIDAAYVSPLKYRAYDCEQLALEMDYVGQRTNKLHQRLKSESNSDDWQMGVGLILFWPSLFFIEGGDGPDAAEYARLKGEFEALRTSSVQGKCAIIAKSPEQIMKETDEASKEAGEDS